MDDDNKSATKVPFISVGEAASISHRRIDYARQWRILKNYAPPSPPPYSEKRVFECSRERSGK